MKTESLQLCSVSTTTRRLRGNFIASFIALLFAALLISSASAQQKQRVKQITRLPAPEKIVANYLKAVGGKKRLAAIKDASYEWSAQQAELKGSAKTQTKAPASARFDVTLGEKEFNAGSSTSSAWSRTSDGIFRTLTGPEAGAARLEAIIEASRLIDYKKQNVLARTVSLDETGSEPAYVVEFSMRNGARLRYFFGVNTKLLLKVVDEVRKAATSFADYRAENGVLEPHSVEMAMNDGDALALKLQRAAYNQGLADSVFDPPQSAEGIDVAALMREVSRNQDEDDERLGEYTYKQKVTQREISDKGELKKETVNVYEVYPVPHHAPVMKLISENGVPLTEEKAAKEEKRVAAEMEKAVKEAKENKEKAARQKAERARKRAEEAKKKGQDATSEDDDPDIADFLRVCEFISPRRERLGDRDTIVFDFRPKPGFRPTKRDEEIISKLVGIVWIDPADKQVMRLEARLAQGFKIAGGLLLSLRPGASIVMEQTRMTDGVWLPRFAQANLSVKVLLFAGGDINQTVEWSDYQRAKADVGDYKLDSPKDGTKKETAKPKP